MIGLEGIRVTTAYLFPRNSNLTFARWMASPIECAENSRSTYSIANSWTSPSSRSSKIFDISSFQPKFPAINFLVAFLRILLHSPNRRRCTTFSAVNHDSSISFDLSEPILRNLLRFPMKQNPRNYPLKAHFRILQEIDEKN